MPEDSGRATANDCGNWLAIILAGTLHLLGRFDKRGPLGKWPTVRIHS